METPMEPSPGRQKLQVRLRDLVNPRHAAPGVPKFKVNDPPKEMEKKNANWSIIKLPKLDELIIDDYLIILTFYMCLYLSIYPVCFIFVCEACSCEHVTESLSFATPTAYATPPGITRLL